MTQEKTGEIGLSGALRLRRAASELAAARPVVITEPGAEGGQIVLASEHLTPARLAALRRLGPVRLLLTAQRAAHLRLRLYTGEVVALTLGPEWDAAAILALADPAQDPDHPLHGPLASDRAPPSPALAAGLRLAHLAGLLPSVVAVALPGHADAFAAREGFLAIAGSLIADADADADPGPLEAALVTEARLPIAADAKAQLLAFRAKPAGLWGDGEETETHYALAIGAPDPGKAPLVRLHSECFTGDLLGSLKCDCGDQLKGALARIAEEGSGLLIYLRQEGRGIGLLNKLRAYHLQDQGFDTVEANERLGFAEDERSFLPAVRILQALGFKRIRLLTNNPKKVEALRAAGIDVVERVGHSFPANPHNAHYLSTKRNKSGHFL